MRALALLVLLAACEDRPAPTASGPPRMEQGERQRGMALCNAYVARLCRCAEKDAGLKERCELAKGMPQGLELHTELLDGQKGALNDRERRLTEAGAREIVAACVAEDGKLDPAQCPR